MSQQQPSQSALQRPPQLAAEQQANFLIRIFTREFDFGGKYQSIATVIVIGFAIIYALAFLGLMQYVAYLGPGLGDNLDFSPYLQVFDHFYQAAGGSWLNLPLLSFAILSLVNVVFTAAIIIAGYWLYPKTMGKPFPVTVLFTYLSLNAVCTVGIGFIHVLIGVAAGVLGFDFILGLKAFGHLLAELRLLAMSVPTLVEMPAWLAFFVLQMAGGFFHYWFHRLAHESRVLWLLFHRTHHMTPELIQPSTQSVFNAFPFFLFAAVPYVIIFTVVGKLVTAESLLIYLIIYKLISAFSNLFSHQSALYDWSHKKWPILLLSTITSEGVYHYLHHSAEVEHNQARGNLVNIGGGLFFFWDRVFGTYLPVTANKPRVGLRGIEAEEMTTNPLRLAFAGIAQLVYELWHNRSLKNWILIVIGGSDFTPDRSKDYVVRGA